MPLLLSKVRHLLATAETNIGNLTASEGHDTRDSVKALAAQKGVPVVLHLIFRTTDCLRNLTAMGGCAHAEVWGLGCSSACCFSVSRLCPKVSFKRNALEIPRDLLCQHDLEGLAWNINISSAEPMVDQEVSCSSMFKRLFAQQNAAT